MKYLLFILLLGCSAPKPLTLIITHVDRETGTVYGRNSYRVFRAEIPNLPDSIKPGKTIILNPTTKDSCKCIFKRVK